MNVKLYSRPRSNGMSSLYLKYYPAIFSNTTGEMMQYEYLGLNIYTSPASKEQRAFNKQALELAEKVKCKRTLECFQSSFGICKGDGNFLIYFYKNSQNRNGKYNAVYHYLKKFTEGRCSFKDLSVSFCDRFRDYMTKQECIHYSKTLEHNSVAGYYTAFLHILQLAYKDRLIQENIASEANKIHWTHPDKEYLTKMELEKIESTEWEDLEAKNAFLFACYTGFRCNDVLNLEWKDIRQEDDGIYMVRLKVSKSKCSACLPISTKAMSFIGKSSRGKVFPTLNYSRLQKQMKLLLAAAGITRKITFHDTRHSFAMNLNSEHVPIQKIQKLLCHKNISTTMIYVKMSTEDVRDAVENL